ncbi:MAG: hypothetical protein JSU59_04600 [Nitrospirota bacterium]|nr:MAG: hypothetical protein JSU59_04600 [Nitrospirota bacterium]
MILSLWILACVLSPSISAADDQEDEPRLPLAMEVFLKKPKKDQYNIHIHLTNVSQEPVEVNVHDLPWTPPNDSKWFLAYRMDSNKTPIKQTSWRGKFGSRIVRLIPGESIQDKLALNPRFPSLLKDIDQFGVQLQWECPPPTLKFECKNGTPNTLTIPKADPGQPDVYAINQTACLKLEQTIGLISIPRDHDVLFVLTTESVMKDLKQVQSLLLGVDDYVQQCQPMWTNSWAVSFFTDKKYAGFLRDEENKLHFEKGLWQQANIGQYSSQIRTLFRFPWIRKKAETVYLSVYQLRQNNK